ncbi:LysM peptidoglycan-binding domain-containing protein [Bacillus velezensis]|uniref:Glycoside hydrolase family 18 protein n=1 Tax=Bacillus amyloliquefaciens TaxID=1390 RepID=A0AAP3YJ64_BACAM|nr:MULTISPECIES: glycoside hydrolase family 18 protein [Bacillus]AWQ15401.1 LysM peptidoglycan-binding domain-containing protein [Bacillus velezensis]MBM7031133.1 glycoside hydrolase family 18 protein [Bacillus velezensis]MBS0049075.1 glycoside hydrolase family 18 protein [Bacillus velezensis]MDF4196161.1 glycoside hydrolase family 18 protein [Bacillus amyloliquefaciens]MDF4215251.1 glycoside hydrolase family 18 protein [Bacillus amyloliquefaciens]
MVKRGDTLSAIAARYRTAANVIAEANKLPNPNTLVVGQTLVIPIEGQYYEVKQGDTLAAIAGRFHISAAELARVNGIQPGTTLRVGTRLYIPQQANKPDIESNAYIEPRGTSVSANLQQAAREASPYLTYLGAFSFQVQRNGTLKEPPLTNLKSISDRHNTTLMMIITNLENDAFSDELGRLILNDNTVKTKLFQEIVSTAKKHGFRDIHFDFEYLRPQDREAYNRFLREARTIFHREGWKISTALAPKTSATQAGKWYEAHDYRAHGEIVDFVVIMTYEWGYSGGPAQAVSPIGPVRNVIEYALTEMPSSKIVMGQNMYGYDWTLPFKQGTTAKAVSPQQAIALAARHKVDIQYDETAQAPFFRYTDENQRRHEVWFEDARSIQAKFNLIKELHLRGISYWKLGLSFPQNWLLLNDQFHIVKETFR